MRKLGVALLSLALGCGSTASNNNTNPPSPDLGTPGAPPGADGGAGTSQIGGTVTGQRTLAGDVQVTDNLTIAAGATLTVAAGTLMHVASGKQIVVQGTLQTQGTAAQPVTLQSQAGGSGTMDWQGIGVSSGGSLVLRGTTIRNAQSALQTAAGGSFDIDGLTVSSSATGARLQSSGTIKHSAFHGNGASQSGDTLFITNASPQISDTVFDNGNMGTDMIEVDGSTSAPVFDHVEVSDAHCDFHFNAGSQITISSSYVHDAVFGLMAEGAKNTSISGNNFEQNQINIGQCAGGTVNAVGNYFIGAAFDASCSTQTLSGPQNQPLSGIGPRP